MAAEWKRVTGVIWVLDYFTALLLLQRLRSMSCREGRAEPEMRSAKRTTLCRALQSCFVALLYHTEMHWVSTLFYGPWIESFQDCWRDPEFPQLSQMVQSLPGFLDLCWNCAVQVRSSEMFTPRYLKLLTLSTGVPLIIKRSVGPLAVSLPEVYNQLFSFAHVQRETVVLAPWC